MEAPGEGQVEPKMGPSWGKRGSKGELDGISGHLKKKMGAKFHVRAILGRRMARRWP